MTKRLTDEQLSDYVSYPPDAVRNPLAHSLATELVALRAAWRIAEPHLLYPVRRRCLAVLSDAPQ